jgi:tRNA-splicing ligase RtcB
MPDVHVATEFCVGTVVGAENTLFPMAVGGDIGCGMLAMRFDADGDTLRDAQNAAAVFDGLYERCPSRRHHRNLAPKMPDALLDSPTSHTQLESWLRGEARLQLGTLGSGNHFLEFQVDEADDALWLMIHTGSRNFGQLVLQRHLPACKKTATNLFSLAADSPAGQAYLRDVETARKYASENRRALAMNAARVLENLFNITPRIETLTDCDHNHVQRETIAGESLWIHRKGATYAGSGAVGIIPGSMAGPSFHTEGRGSADALDSSSHGAGRAMSRVKAREAVSVKKFQEQMKHIWFDHRLSRQLREESPAAYKPVREVMRAQTDLTKITRTLTPLLCYKGV